MTSGVSYTTSTNTSGYPTHLHCTPRQSGVQSLPGIGQLTGSIEKGKYADMIVTAGNPLDDLRVLRNLEMVITKGNIIDHPKIKKRKNVDAELDKFL